MKEDLRVKKTKKAIEDSMLELLEERDFEEIFLVDIAKKAQVNRNTIYLHYASKEDIIQSIVTRAFQEQMDKLQINEYMKMRNNKHKITVMFQTIFDIIEDQIDLYRIVLTSPSLSGNIQKLIFDIKKYIKQVVKDTPRNELIINYLLGGIFSYFSNWIIYATGTKEENIKILTDVVIATSRQLNLI